MKGKIIIHYEKCKACHLCMTFCPKGAIRISSKLNAKGYGHAEFIPEAPCTGCATCALMCPEAIIEVYRD
ncbi:MAG: 4Fe-4S dicluster domain-containing protein [Deltaproteobacteria bacterium]|jgi:2-oxoglutarate ferredoxin oxidoreductase subunit delta|nr:MAG: 4Fe-4S dicluster domain-containing protein [Deltaproteobacteria bacterium]